MGDASNILTAAQLADLRRMAAAVNDPVGAVIGALLRHLDALTAPADGEALGRLAWRILCERAAAHGIRERVSTWEQLPEDRRAQLIVTSVAAHERGYAAGALSREGEIAALREDLEGERRAYAVRAETERTEIARLTAELERDGANYVALQSQLDQVRGTRAKREDAARADGAREERRIITGELSIEFERLSRIEHDRGERFPPGDAEGDAHDAARDAYNEAAKLVRARGGR